MLASPSFNGPADRPVRCSRCSISQPFGHPWRSNKTSLHYLRYGLCCYALVGPGKRDEVSLGCSVLSPGQSWGG